MPKLLMSLVNDGEHMNFADAVNNIIDENSNYTSTENGGKQLATTQSALLDLFATIGAMRNKTDDEIEAAFASAYAENPLLAVRMAFYARDIRHGGLGERRVFRKIINLLADYAPATIIYNINLIPYFGRFDDLFALIGTQVERVMWEYITKTFNSDIANLAMGLEITQLAKWMPSVNTSSQKTRAMGKLCARHLHLSEKDYRISLSKLRNRIDVVERKMSSNRWEEINYEAVPSNAMKNYRNAFFKHSPRKYVEYLNNVKKGTAKINAHTLYPYDILRAYGLGYGYGHGGISSFSVGDFDATLEEQWKALPNYVSGENNVLVMADTSGSMMGLPMDISIGLAIYFAERNNGAYKDLFLTFSEEPKFVKLTGSTLKEKVECINMIVENTNIERAFDLILKTAIDNNIEQSEMPKTLIVITDMEFDDTSDDDVSYNTAKRKFEMAGYTLPTVVFWNVSQRTKGFQASKCSENVILVSGSSAGTFHNVINNIGTTPYEFMINTLNSEPYNQINLK